MKFYPFPVISKEGHHENKQAQQLALQPCPDHTSEPPKVSQLLGAKVHPLSCLLSLGSPAAAQRVTETQWGLPLAGQGVLL